MTLQDQLKRLVVQKGRRSQKVAYMVHIDDLRELLKMLKLDGFRIERGRTVDGKRAAYYNIGIAIDIMGTSRTVTVGQVYVDTHRSMERGQVYAFPAPVSSLLGEPKR